MIKHFNFLFLKLVLFGAIFPSVSYEAKAAFQSSVVDLKAFSILDQTQRPTIQDIVKVFGGFNINQNPYRPLKHREDLNTVVQAGAQMIVQLEYAFPGARIAALGRDAAVAADILEAFYLSLGQPNRIVRLNASGPTFRQPEDYTNLLHSVNLVDASGKELENFVIVDTTSWQVHSQVRQLIASVYNAHPVGARQALLSKVNAVALRDGHLPITPGTHPLRVSIGKDGPDHILSTTGAFSYGGEGYWHGSFLALTQDSKGSYYAPPGQPKMRSEREHGLWLMVEIVKTILSPQFQSALETNLQYYGLSKDHFKASIAGIKPSSLAAHLTSLKYRTEWEETIAEYSEMSNHFQRTFLIESAEVFASYFVEMLRHNLAPEMVGKMSLILPSPFAAQFVNLHVVASDTAERFVNILQDSSLNKSLLPGLLVESNFALFFALHPSVDQINQLIQIAKKNSPAHLSIATMALSKLGSRIEYKALRKPSKSWKQDIEYKDAVTNLKLKYPRTYPFWHVKHWTKVPSTVQSQGEI